MNTDNYKMQKCKFVIFGVVRRLLRVILTPLIFATMILVALSAVISIPIWVFSGKTLVPLTTRLAGKHMEFCWD